MKEPLLVSIIIFDLLLIPLLLFQICWAGTDRAGVDEDVTRLPFHKDYANDPKTIIINFDHDDQLPADLIQTPGKRVSLDRSAKFVQDFSPSDDIRIIDTIDDQVFLENLKDIDPQYHNQDKRSANVEKDEEVIVCSAADFDPHPPTPRNSVLRSYLGLPQTRWPHGQVPYVISPTFTDSEKELIYAAMDHIMDNSCIRFVPRSEEDKDFVLIFTGAHGCWADFAFVEGRGTHQVHLHRETCMYLGTIAHELLHILGAGHEHSRPDRDKYVTINWSTITNKLAPSFFRDQWFDDPKRLPRCSPDGKPNGYDYSQCVSGRRRKAYGFHYDYQSIMHYSERGFSVENGSSNLVPTDPSVKALGSSRMTYLDIEKLNAAYGCEGHNGIGCSKRLSGSSGRYHANIADDGCEILIGVPQGQHLQIDFNIFQFKDCNDTVKLWDGPNRRRPLIGTFCGLNVPRVIRATGNEILIDLVMKNQDSKLDITWKTFDPQCCERITFWVNSASYIFRNPVYRRWLGEYKIDPNLVTSITTSEHSQKAWPVYFSMKDPDFWIAHGIKSGYSQSWFFNTLYLNEPGVSRGLIFLLGEHDCPYAKGAQLQYYEHSSGLLLEAGPWDISCSVLCHKSNLPNVSEASVSLPDSDKVPVDVSVTYTCPNGYKTFARCNEDGSWSKPANCAFLIPPDSQSRTMVSGCPRGYRQFMDTNATIELMSNGFDRINLYKPDQICSWRFMAKKNSDRFLLEIEPGFFSVEGSSRCAKDSVLVVSEKRRVLCGTVRRHVAFLTEQSHVSITFKTDAIGHDIGFKIKIKVISSSSSVP